jgi:hypothetical protein
VDADFDFLFDVDPDADPDPTFHPDADPDPDPDPYPSFKKRLKKGLNRLISHTFWLDICKLMRIRIQLINLDEDPDANPDIFDASADLDVDPGYQNDGDPCRSGSGSRSTTLV